ncbi:D-galactarate dehydratase [Gemmobacter caeruleus]|uniref:D-galactarate dehydratase n=1 Tax=Gemmobacter caeruleus TaxID=2595004 RepID=UPI001EF02DB0|nr:D-galactarate dehydratase [Gemmobacter caeruleus]
MQVQVMMRLTGAGVLALALAGCAGGLPFGRGGAAAPAPQNSPVPPADPAPQVSLPELAAPPPRPGARTAETLDTTTPEQRAAATATPAPAAEAALGRVSVTLGDPTAPGFWLKSGLVSSVRPGLVKTTGGQTVQVELQPGDGAAQLSLAAFRALGLSLTDLPEVEVFGR